MSGASDDFLHAWMRRLDGKLTHLIDDNKEFRTGLGRLETSLVELNVHMTEQSVRLDRMSTRLDRVERRLDLREADALT